MRGKASFLMEDSREVMEDKFYNIPKVFKEFRGNQAKTLGITPSSYHIRYLLTIKGFAKLGQL